MNLPPDTRPISTIRIGVDTGGTFTDFTVWGAGAPRVFKVPSTPSDPSRAVLEGLKRVLGAIEGSSGRAWPVPPSKGRQARTISMIHGTTVGTNALLTRSGARTAFVTTAGFEDLVEIGRQNREALYDLLADRPLPLVGRALRFGVAERVFLGSAEGGVHSATGPIAPRAGSRRPPGVGARRTPSAAELSRLRKRLVAARVESIAVGLLHSYLDPTNEILVSRALEPLGVPVTLSHRISCEYREYERWQTAIANAYLQPIVGPYLSRLAERVRPARLTILQSDGTTATAAAAALEPIRTALSGPAGGVLAALALARRLGDRKVISFDMGGTSTDVALLDGALPRVHGGHVAGLPVRSPMVEVTTVGAGGGSIARPDAAGALRVGPESAGADPGPACYGRGDAPTVTDAHLVLGRLGQGDLLGGTFPVDGDRARVAVGSLARALGLTLNRCAEGILEVADATMERALRAISLGRGKDPRLYALYAFGGAGGLHACRLAERLGIGRVVIPPAPGAFSALGLASAAPGVEISMTVLALPGEKARLAIAYRTLERQAFARLEDQGIGRAAARVSRFADLRYQGQSHEITVPFSGRMTHTFAGAHFTRYGYVRPDATIEVVTLRLRATLPEAPIAFGPRRDPQRKGGRHAKVRRSGFAIVGGTGLTCALIARDALGRGMALEGPARITEYSATVFVPPGWVCTLGSEGALILVPSSGRSRRRHPKRGKTARRSTGSGALRSEQRAV